MVRPPDKPTAKSGKPTSEVGNPDPRLSVWDVLREFVTDIEAVYGTNGALDLIREWEDLHITYQHAKEVLAKAERRDPEVMESIARSMDIEAESWRVLRDNARRHGETSVADGAGDRAQGFVLAAKLIRGSSTE